MAVYPIPTPAEASLSAFAVGLDALDALDALGDRVDDFLADLARFVSAYDSAVRPEADQA
ncbi:MAG: hypothetical protein L0G69_02985 [Brevibacterium sp.]|uniref:hypothetical protein n=1 Tax=Brevibacterium sandarakinum TaxID=629680 RepID=UPI00265081ED|nr:hypothetical protein [Brevibacterium sandarakinum]MDN5585507.1 hypothetical protein [Brevibacterium sp.]MDN5657161.1 hypothetical protein [Brevibacterium sandarakinum]